MGVKKAWIKTIKLKYCPNEKSSALKSSLNATWLIKNCWEKWGKLEILKLIFFKGKSKFLLKKIFLLFFNDSGRIRQKNWNRILKINQIFDTQFERS